jgi:hypothetical protein
MRGCVLRRVRRPGWRRVLSDQIGTGPLGPADAQPLRARSQALSPHPRPVAHQHCVPSHRVPPALESLSLAPVAARRPAPAFGGAGALAAPRPPIRAKAPHCSPRPARDAAGPAYLAARRRRAPAGPAFFALIRPAAVCTLS